MPTEIDPDTVLDALADGLSMQKVSRRYHLPLAEVRKIMTEATERCYNGGYLREHWMLEDRRLFAMEMKFWHKAMDEGNASDAMVAVKTSERRAVLAGANMPQSHVLHVATQPAEDKRTSTEQLRDVIDELCHITSRERCLIDKRDIAQEALSDDEASELEALQIERATNYPLQTAS